MEAKKTARSYWSLIRRHIREQRWAWLERVIADNRSYPMGLHEWLIVEIDLKQQLAGYAEAA